VTAEADLERAYLRDLVTDGGHLDRKAVERRLLGAMQEHSSPLKPETLGILGEQHFRDRLAAGTPDAAFRYKRLVGFDARGLPYAVECAFSIMSAAPLQGAHIGMNWSVPLSNPIQSNGLTTADGDVMWGLGGLLSSQRIWLDRDPV
jgi:hypothetical protein